MTVFEAFVLGLIQGLTEFLPVSSSGHMILAGKFLGLYSVPIAFELVMHLATLIAVIIILRKDVVKIIKKPLQKTTLYIIAATLCSFIIVIVFKNFLRDSFSGDYLFYCFLITAIILILPELLNNFTKSNKRLLKSQPTLLDSAIIGLSQGIAVLPGISRSGTTISTAKILGVDSKGSATFSFLISIPIIVGSSAIELISNSSAIGVSAFPLIIGFLTSFIAGILSLKLMLKILNNKSLDMFSVYLFLLCVFLLVDRIWLHII